MDRDSSRAKLEALGLDVATLIVDDAGTIVADPRHAPKLSEINLPTLTVGPPAPGKVRDLVLQETIGSGGMATVWTASQPSLERRVAVKELLPERRTEVARDELLREARLAGSLEHPNIVPIHALGLTETGWPIIVMKFIEGTPWADALTPLYVDDRQPTTEELDEQLRIFMKVCTAVDFAHDRSRSESAGTGGSPSIGCRAATTNGPPGPGRGVG